MGWLHKTLLDAENAIRAGNFKEFKNIIDEHSAEFSVPFKNNVALFENNIRCYLAALSRLMGMTRIDGTSRDNALQGIRDARAAADGMRNLLDVLQKYDLRLK